MTRFIRDDFAGPGGWSEGLRLLGLDDVLEVGVELDLAAALTARAAGHKRWHADVTSEAVRTYVWPTLWGYIASPPCQTFSAAGKGEGRKHLDSLIRALWLVARGVTPQHAVAAVSDAALDVRSVLVLEPMLAIRDHRPTWIAFEQVPQVLPVWEAYAKILTQWGYHVATGLVYAEQHGVPQTRKRAALVAHAERPVSLPKPTHSRYYSHDRDRLDDDVLPWVSMAQALGGALADEADQWLIRSNYGTGGDPKARGERAATEPAAAVTSKAGRNRWQYAAAGQVHRELHEPARTVTVQEAAVLQSFRADYPWQGFSTKQYEQVGNAIPPLLARAILAELTA